SRASTTSATTRWRCRSSAARDHGHPRGRGVPDGEGGRATARRQRMRRAAYLTPGRDLATAVELARRAEALGYESVWVTHGLGRDSFLVLAAYGAATTRLGLGVGVVPIYPRHPVAMAQAALTLAEATRGRFTLGIGVSHRAMIEGMLGLALDAPLAVMREYVAVLRERWGPAPTSRAGTSASGGASRCPSARCRRASTSP